MGGAENGRTPWVGVGDYVGDGDIGGDGGWIGDDNDEDKLESLPMAVF